MYARILEVILDVIAAAAAGASESDDDLVNRKR